MLAGCVEPASIEAIDVNNSKMAERTSRSFETLGDENSPKSRIRNTIKLAIVNGSGTIISNSPPIDRGQIIEYNNSYYNISWETIDKKSGRRVSIEINYNP